MNDSSLLFRRRVPMNAHPDSTRSDDQRPVEFECGSRRSTTGCQANNLRTVFIPGKMVSPTLRTRIIQRDDLSRHRIDSFRSVEFEPVARGAGQTKVFGGGCATPGKRYDVVYMAQLSAEPFGDLAILTSVMRTLTHQPDEVPGQPICRHR